MAAQERETSERPSVAASVGTAAVVATVVAAVTLPVATVVAAVTVGVAAVAVRRTTFERPSITDTRDGPREEDSRHVAAD
jgi:hypothetical protein